MSHDSDRSTRRTVLRRVGAGAVSIGAIAGGVSGSAGRTASQGSEKDVEIDYFAAEPSLLASGEKTDFILSASGDDYDEAVIKLERCDGVSDWECTDPERVNVWKEDYVWDRSYDEPGFYRLRGWAMPETGPGVSAYRNFFVDDGSIGALPEPVVSGPTRVRSGESVTFDLHSSTMEYGDITFYSWFVDGDPQWGELEPTFETSFDEPGTYAVKGGVRGTLPSDYGPYDLHNDLESSIHTDTLEVTVTE
ncbi:PKD domain-containing protein [Halovivax cerinus]|uniref:PKD domain-containing protein n=1 Tax=Halovivax cerinus TaxID=1487865 RepID=A0ABD5NIU7_9EURY|nr:PKD domain-containing protein [Halovivax cerinus]